ncbi:hypothetical protein LIL_13030 [Leptospira interrogans serovar Linhai str. 56609]|nr:hypothetical protein LIL_13030 [Leptospira interrogans serovar Linhai str. 56609]
MVDKSLFQNLSDLRQILCKTYTCNAIRRERCMSSGSETLSSGKRFAELNFDSKILFNFWVGYDRERFAQLLRTTD